MEWRWIRPATERRDINATGLRTDLWLCDLGAELPLGPMAVLDPKQKSTTDGYQKGGSYADPHKNP